jgi:membrane dipeptidase
MNKTFLAASLLLSLSVAGQDAKKLHEQAIVVDTHNDFISKAIDRNVMFEADLRGIAHSDLSRMKQGGIDVQVFSIFCDETFGPGKAYAMANREMDSLYAYVKRNPDKMMLVTNPKELKQAVKAGKLASMMGVEGGHMIEDKFENLDALYARGARYMTLTWNNSTWWASSAMDETKWAKDGKLPDGRKPGLNDYGKAIVRRMNELGMIVDISHVGEQTFWDAIHTTTKPVIASHSCAWSLCPVFRNLKDDQIKAVGENGGVIQLNFYSGFVDSTFMRKNEAFIAAHKSEVDDLMKSGSERFNAEARVYEKYKDIVESFRPPLSMLLDHLDHIVKLIGVDHVGLGSDFDGIQSAPRGLDDVTSMPLVTQELVKRGYSAKDITKILGGNFIRVFEANQRN